MTDNEQKKRGKPLAETAAEMNDNNIDTKDCIDEALRAEKEAHLDCERELLELKDQLEESQRKFAEARDAALRAQADFDNYRKRNLDSVRKAREDGAEEVVTAILPLSDIMDQAIGMITDSNVAMGVKMIKRQLIDILSGLGVSEYDPTGEVFDPAVHNAVGRKAVDGAESGTIVEVINKGYIKGDKVIRHANVLIAQD